MLIDLTSGSQRGTGSGPEQSWGSQAGEVPSLQLVFFIHSLMNKVLALLETLVGFLGNN